MGRDAAAARRAEKNLVLIGFMASGKSTIGRRCARELGYRFLDADAVVEHRAGKSIKDIFADDGEAVFRTLEAETLRDLARQKRVVIATGGGAAMDGVNVARLRRSGVVILLWTDPEEILVRCGSRATRPLLADADDPAARIAELLGRREPLYRAAAHAVVETTGLSRDEAAEHVIAAYYRIIDHPRAPHHQSPA